MGKRVNYSGLVIAGIGFFLTRFTVTLAIYQDPVRFYLAGVVPLALGLVLAAFGVALAVADVETSVVRTTALWCVVGAGAMLVLVVLTLLGSTPGGMPDFATVRSQTYLSNFLIGGSVGGTLTGLYAARSRHQRDRLQQQTHRLAVLNRLLRHEVLNAVTVIRGYATGDRDEDPSPDDADAAAVIEEYSTTIEQTIEEVKYLTRSTAASGGPDGSVALADRLAESAAVVRDRHPGASVSVRTPPEPPSVRADERLGQVFVELIENAVVHSAADDPAVDVSVSASRDRVRVSVSDEGPGLPQSKRDLLETGEIEEFDDPGSGFGLNVVRLLVESYGGSIDTRVDPSGSTIAVDLQRAEAGEPALRRTRSSVTGVRLAVPHLTVTLAAAVVAGVAYGLVAEQFGGSVAFIGVYYGVADPVVGWITHEFHSVVFAFVFAGLVSLAPAAYRNHVPAYAAIGMVWAVVVWFVATGFVSPIWLRLLGVPAQLPSFSFMLLLSHLAWGLTLGVLTAWGCEHVAPKVARLDAEWQRGSGAA